MNIKDLLKDSYREGMTLEEIEAALANIELPSQNAEIEKLKTALSNSNAEAAKYKKELREKLSQEEITAKERAEQQEKLQADYDALLKKVSVSDNKAKLLALGYEDKLATSTAEAMVNGELDKVLTYQKQHLEMVEKKIRADVLNATPKPQTGGGEATITKEQFDNMGYHDRLKIYNDNPELYHELNGGN